MTHRTALANPRSQLTALRAAAEAQYVALAPKMKRVLYLVRSVLAVAVLAGYMHVLHECGHGVAAVAIGRPLETISVSPFNGQLATYVEGPPEAVLYYAPVIMDALVFGISFVALAFGARRLARIRELAIAAGLVIPALDTASELGLGSIRHSDFAVIRHLDPQFPAVVIASSLLLVYAIALAHEFHAGRVQLNQQPNPPSG